MEDRNVQYPNRFRMTKVAGTDDIYDLIPAPGEITAEGTLINKATLLKDTTAALFCLGADAVPDDVLKVLSRFHNGMGNEYVWEKIVYSESFEEYAPGGTGRPLAYTGRGAPKYSDKIRILPDGSVEMVDPVSTTAGWVISNYKSLVGKYYYNDDTSDPNMNNILFKIGEDVSWYINGSWSINVTSGVYKVTAAPSVIGYVNSPDPSAYPPAVSDGYTYTPLGQMGSKVQIATGSYVGTGTYDSSNPNSLTFDFEPKIVFISTLTTNNYGNFGLLFPDSSVGLWLQGNLGANQTQTSNGVKTSLSGKTVSWYSNISNPATQFNTSDLTYNYIAIG